VYHVIVKRQFSWIGLLARNVLLAFAVASILAGCGAPTASTDLPDGVRHVDPPVQLNDFALTNQQNQTVHLRDLEGKATLITFGYTHCPDICPINLANFKLIKKALGENAAQVNFVFFSVDSKRDTPDVLAKHLQLFDPTFIGITGDDAAILPVTQQFGAFYQIATPEPGKTDYLVVHTASSYLVDKGGKVIRNYEYQTQPDVIAADILQTLKAS